MNNPILIIAVIAVAVGVFGGVLIVGLIYLQRRRQVVDSLIRVNNVVGCFGTVEVPLNHKSPGKVRINLKGSLVDFIALTEETQQLNQGDRIVVVRTKGNKVWVVAM
ncbi:MAG: NfeD-like protein [Desmonostoc vinosum HA7617-LM4]|jgi:membrane protein implicated in regulation of membrane protease activity|nr:NfeD-like protein [Desmonostoc vinosum HA7617-LM4]